MHACTCWPSFMKLVYNIHHYLNLGAAIRVQDFLSRTQAFKYIFKNDLKSLVNHEYAGEKCTVNCSLMGAIQTVF